MNFIVNFNVLLNKYIVHPLMKIKDFDDMHDVYGMCCTPKPSNMRYKGKGQVHPITDHEGPEGELCSFFDFGARWGGWSTSRHGRFTPGKDPVPIV